MLSTTSYLYPQDEHHWSVNSFRPCIFGNHGVVWPHWTIIIQLAVFLGKKSCNNIVIISENQHPRSVNGASTIFEPASWILYGCWNAANPQSTHRQPVTAKLPVTMLCLPPTIECPQSVNNFCGGSASCTAIKCIVLFLNCVLHGQALQYVLVYNITNMHAMSHRSDCFACSSRVNI